MIKFSFIIPTLNEANFIQQTLNSLQALRCRGHEVIVVDGGSDDETLALTSGLTDNTIQANKGRATQFNAGARLASGDILIFLHADTKLPANVEEKITKSIKQPSNFWGRFDVRFDNERWVFSVIAFFTNLRSRITAVATGDQAIFVARDLFSSVGAFPEQALMEDVEISKRLRKHSRPVCLHARVTTSSRRWQRNGILRTILLMWWLRLAYFCGADPTKLADIYCPSTKYYLFPKARILVFAKTPEPGRVKTRMQPELTAQQCSELQELMIEHTLATATSRQLCSVELWHTDKPNSFINNCAKKFDVTLIQQDGGNLGERMLHALSVTLKNADSALIVGSDCPPLTSSHLLRALQALHEHKTSVVLIPAKDGGYVLIGMRTVESELFQNIDWSSNKVLQQTRNKIQLQQLSCLELESLWDLDRPIDLQRLKELGNTKFWEPFL